MPGPTNTPITMQLLLTSDVIGSSSRALGAEHELTRSRKEKRGHKFAAAFLDALVAASVTTAGDQLAALRAASCAAISD